jgi:N-acetylmuramoyl-L-alanine amidase
MDKGLLSKDRLLESDQRWQAFRESPAARASVPAKEAFAAPGESPLPAAENTATVKAMPLSPPEPAVVEAKPVAEAAPVKEEPAETAARKREPEPPSPVPPPNTEKVVHVIERGETLSRIAAKYGVRADDVAAWNGMTGTDVKYGLKLIIYRPLASADGAVPEPQTTEGTWIHVVAKGENIHKIAGKYGTTRQRLIEMNKLDDPDRLEAGQELRVPVSASDQEASPKGGT